MYRSKNVAFGFRRLSIIDLSPAGHQPMSSPDGQCTIVFNGEIYNHVELRSQLIALGHRFRSSSDTEVLLAAYRQWGPDCVHRFNGMWAFVIHDQAAGILFGARDRLGVKPLYFRKDPAWLVLASEPVAIGAFGRAPLEPDWQRLADSIVHSLMDHDGGSCLAGIAQIGAGCRFTIDSQGTLSQERYWQLPDQSLALSQAVSPRDWIGRLGELLTDSLRLRQRSDVPIGFTLSGGIDSSLLICEAARMNGANSGLQAFSYQDRAYDEREPIRDTVAQSGATLHSIDDATLDVAALLSNVVQANGEPVHSFAAAANYSLFGLAKRHGVKVVIGGQGADEVLGGYTNYQWDYWHSLAGDRRWTTLVRDVRAYARLHGTSAAFTLMRSLSRSVRIAVADTDPYRRLRAVVDRRPPVTETTRLFTSELLARAQRLDLRSADFRIAASQRRSLESWPLPMYLRIEDRCSMAHSVEARLPFTDYRVVEHGLLMPDTLKHAGGLNKVALRRVAAGKVPASVTSRVRKFGFPVGASPVTQARLRALCADLVASRAFRERGIYDQRAVAQLLAASAGPVSETRTDALFHLAQIELWIDGLRPAWQPLARSAA